MFFRRGIWVCSESFEFPFHPIPFSESSRVESCLDWMFDRFHVSLRLSETGVDLFLLDGAVLLLLGGMLVS